SVSSGVPMFPGSPGSTGSPTSPLSPQSHGEPASESPESVGVVSPESVGGVATGMAGVAIPGSVGGTKAGSGGATKPVSDEVSPASPGEPAGMPPLGIATGLAKTVLKGAANVATPCPVVIPPSKPGNGWKYPTGTPVAPSNCSTNPPALGPG